MSYKKVVKWSCPTRDHKCHVLQQSSYVVLSYKRYQVSCPRSKRLCGHHVLQDGILKIIFRTFKTWSFHSGLSPEALSCHCGHCRQLLPPSRRTRRRSWPPPWRSWCCWWPRVWPGRWRSSRRKMSTSLLSSMTRELRDHSKHPVEGELTSFLLGWKPFHGGACLL